MSDDDALWQPRQQSSDTTRVPAHQVPRWQHIQTSSEQQDTQNSIRALGKKTSMIGSFTMVMTFYYRGKVGKSTSTSCSPSTHGSQ